MTIQDLKSSHALNVLSEIKLLIHSFITLLENIKILDGEAEAAASIPEHELETVNHSHLDRLMLVLISHDEHRFDKFNSEHLLRVIKEK